MAKNCKLTTDIDDIIVWPDGTYCYRYELHEFRHKSDDYEVLYFNSTDYRKFLMENVNE